VFYFSIGPTIKPKVRTTGNIFICCQRIFLTEKSYHSHRKGPSCYDRSCKQPHNDDDGSNSILLEQTPQNIIEVDGPPTQAEKTSAFFKKSLFVSEKDNNVMNSQSRSRLLIAPKKTQFKRTRLRRREIDILTGTSKSKDNPMSRYICNLCNYHTSNQQNFKIHCRVSFP